MFYKIFVIQMIYNCKIVHVTNKNANSTRSNSIPSMTSEYLVAASLGDVSEVPVTHYKLTIDTYVICFQMIQGHRLGYLQMFAFASKE